MLRRGFVSILGALGALHRRIAAGQGNPPAPAKAATGPGPLTLWYRQPARNWLEAIPLGNGRLGAMVFGVPAEDRVVLNEDTLYSEEPEQRDVPLDYGKDFAHVTGMIRAGQYQEAAEYVTQHWLGRAQPCYQPVGELRIRFAPTHDVAGYTRSLDLTDALCQVRYVYSGVALEREYFTSCPDNVLVMRFRGGRPGSVAFHIGLDSPHPHLKCSVTGPNEVAFAGQVPGLALRREFDFIESKGDGWKYPEVYHRDGSRKPGAQRVLYGEAVGGRGARFEVRIQVRTEDAGSVVSGPTGLTVTGASSAMVLVAVASSFNGFDRSPSRDGADPSARNTATLAPLAGKTYNDLRTTHIRDYKSLFDRVELDLGGPAGAARAPSDQRLREAGISAGKPDPSLDALYFQFGRYLMIAGSRPGSQPLNLQGIWNVDVIPPWAGAYTTNINIQMNYWSAETTNLSELHEPLFRLLREVAVTGSRTAQQVYHRPGWVLHHNTSIWRGAQPVDNLATYSFWPMAGGWFSQHLWDHYLYTRDREFLRAEAYPLMKGAAEFYSAWLVEDGSGKLTTPVSTSPENEFYYTGADGRRRQSGVAQGTTMDIAIIRELFTNVVAAARLLGLDPDFRTKLQSQLASLPEYQVGSRGQLLEWHKEFGEYPPRHDVSPFYPLYPGTEITRSNPRLFEAARVFVSRRSKQRGGWPAPWSSCCWSRLGESEKAYACFRSLLTASTHPNFFNGNGAIFQIDGNLGGTAAVVEMLLQSHEGMVVHLLPALPAAWPAGSVRGLVARGGIEVALSWTGGKLDRADLTFRHDGRFQVRYSGKTVAIEARRGSTHRLSGTLEPLPG